MRVRACVTLALAALGACGQSAPPADPTRDSSPSSESTPDGAASTEEAGPSGSGPAQAAERSDSDDAFGTLAEALGRGDGGAPIPAGLALGGDCAEVGATADEDIVAQASAPVPLKVGLTLASLWSPNPNEDYECLLQVTAVRRDGIDATSDCDKPRVRRHINRRLCRADLDAARMLMTQTGTLTVIDASGEEVPETVAGATWFSLSRAEFAELKRTGSVQHHYVQTNVSGDRLDIEGTTVLRSEGTETAQVAVNDRVIDIPVIRASGEANYRNWGRVDKKRITALIMDNPQFPMLVDYRHTGDQDEPDFQWSFVKISYPSDSRGKGEKSSGGDFGGRSSGSGEMERRLGEEKRVDVYGIYFDFNSARIRKESEPVLQEVADILARNPEWTLSIYGHTDNVGGDAYNLELSRRRGEAVRKTLVDRFGIAGDRLTTGGSGAGAPKDTNDTPEGRARNRRVELVRR